MSRLPASALEEGDHIHAILRPLLAEPGAAQRRANALAVKPEPRTVAYAELDLAIDALLLRMRVDPRPPKSKTQTREAAKPNTRDVKPPTREAARTVPRPGEPQRDGGDEASASQTGKHARTEPSIPPVPDLPPPVPPKVPAGPSQQIPQVPQVPGPPPVPPASTRPVTRTLERAIPPVPVHAPPDTGVMIRADAGTPRQSPDLAAPSAIRAPPVPPRRATPPIYGPDEATGPIVLARPGNAPETFLLYDDIVMLSAMNDRDGLLISLERLLVLSRLEDHVRVFIDANEGKLVGLYESQLKAFSKVPRRKPPAVDNTMPRVFLRGEKVAAVLLLIDGKATINEIVARAPNLNRIETLSVIAQLQRAGILDI